VVRRNRLGAALGLLAILGVARVAIGCSLGNVTQDDCKDDAACVAAFGLGSTCDEGYCTAATACTVNADCRAALGPLTICDGGTCTRSTIDERCTLSEPAELLEGLSAGTPGDVLLLGVMLRADGGNQSARTAAIRLAVREMNEAGGVLGRKLGAVVCNTDGADVAPTIIDELVIHLGDVIGTPVIVGPAETAEVISAINAVLASPAPIALISPSATGVQLEGQTDRFAPEDPVGLVWRTAPSDALQAEVMAAQIAATLADAGEVTVSVLFQADAYGQGFERELRERLGDVAPDITVRSEGFAPDDVAGTIGDAIERAAEEEPAAVVVLAGRAQRTVDVLKRAHDEALLRTLPFFLSDGAKDKAVLLDSGDEGVDAILATAIGTAPYNPDEGSFFDALRSDFDIEASQFGFVAHAYDAAYIAGFGLAHASREGGRLDGAQVAIGLSHLSSGEAAAIGPSSFSRVVDAMLTADGTVNVSGESGPLDFDSASGDAPGPIEVWRVDGDEFETVDVTPG
jgi:branched-chain amino acid transport system substrate-binding protein